jgi:hypothetical protein
MSGRNFTTCTGIIKMAHTRVLSPEDAEAVELSTREAFDVEETAAYTEEEEEREVAFGWYREGMGAVAAARDVVVMMRREAKKCAVSGAIVGTQATLVES